MAGTRRRSRRAEGAASPGAAHPHAAKPRRRKAHRLPPGTAPGTLVADPDAPPPSVRIIAYGPDRVVEEPAEDLGRIPALLAEWPVVWIDVGGLGDVSLIHRLGELLGLHKLALEDVVNVHQRAKVEQYADHLFIVARMVSLDAALETEQVTLFLGERFLLTFQERPGDVFEPVRSRIRGGRGRIRTAGPGYLAYTLLDAIVDHYFPVLEVFGERLEALEDEIITTPGTDTLARIHGAKRDLLTLRRSIWPLRDTVNVLVRDPSPYIQDEDRLYLRDCYDHAIRVMDLVESYREIASGLMDVYLSSLSNRMNEVMKFLTIFASIFIPLGFIAGVYGMNFDSELSPWNLPELHWYWGYPFALTLMLAVALGLLAYFRHKSWL